MYMCFQHVFSGYQVSLGVDRNEIPLLPKTVENGGIFEFEMQPLLKIHRYTHVSLFSMIMGGRV